jgi:cell division protein FtsI/penicillin-binding protein 2
MPEEDHRYRTPAAVPLHEVVSFSSNRGAALLAMRLGEKRFVDYIHKFGFDRRLGYPGGVEVSGLLQPLAKWSKSEITRIPMGHSISTTALQMHQAMTVIANGGVLMKPQLIQEVRNTLGERVFIYDPVPLNRVVSEKTARTLAGMLTAVASKAGTAPEAAIAGFDVAGKTGTTQKFLNGAWSTRNHVVSFVGFFPASAGPGERQVAISVIIDDADHRAPNGVAYGGRVAAPSFRNIGVKLIPILDIKPPGQAALPGLIATTGGRP